MLVGAISNLAGFTLNFAEQWFAVSVIVFSLITLFVPRTSAILAYWNSFFFSMYHGYVHAAEIAIKAGPFNYITGFLISTTILHGLGITIGSLCLYRSKNTDCYQNNS
jgi:urease accessory protein